MLLGLPKSPFDGFCRYGWEQKTVLKQLDNITPKEIHKQCIDSQRCVAFTFMFNSGDGTLYEGGPYNKGDPNGWSSAKKCYVMQGKTGIFYKNV